MSHQPVHISLFCSAKGGVGKSTLAVAKALSVAPPGRGLLVDGDFTGSSLADGLLLEAPALPEDDTGLLDLEVAGVNGFHSVDETRRRRRRRYGTPAGGSHRARLLPYFNDAITYQGEGDCDTAVLGWRFPNSSSIEVWPSSPFRSDVEVALRWLSRSAAERRPVLDRIAGLIVDRVRADPTIRDVVIDLPPGIFGFTEDFFKLVQELRDGPPDGLTFTTDVIIVVTDDRNDLLAAAGDLLVIRASLHPDARMILNRAREPASAIERTLSTDFESFPVRRWMRRIDVHPMTLGRLFLRGGLTLDDASRAQLRDALGGE